MEFIRITEVETFFLIGMNFFGDPFEKASAWSEENQIGELWKRFYKYYSTNSGLIKNVRFQDCTFEIHFITQQTIETGLFDVFAGVIVSRLEDIPIECVARQLPPTRYAVFTLKGEEITSDWGGEILNTWLGKEYEVSYNFSVLCYDKRFKGIDSVESSEMDVYIPVREKNI
ncbi:MAG: GyrI-like domain-containing protein [Clostridia bacterium]|nr:GyrI-like domain-containing protein [Clostridia bacterium]